MKFVRFISGTCVILLCGSATAPSPHAVGSGSASKVTPLILEKNEGERRVRTSFGNRPTPVVLKVDPKNGGSQHLVLGTEELPPGATIPTHKHPNADEILFLQNGTGRVHLGESVREAHAGATVFIPKNTWISVENIGSEPISLIFIFSEPGFDDFIRATSVPEGEKFVPLSKAELDTIRKKHLHDTIYK
jgi:quercetin dioxygenase-like cupin family protein